MPHAWMETKQPAMIACAIVFALLTIPVATDSALGYSFPPHHQPRGSWSGRSAVGDPEH